MKEQSMSNQKARGRALSLMAGVLLVAGIAFAVSNTSATGDDDILAEIQASPFAGRGGKPIVKFETRECKGKGVVLHLEAEHTEEFSVVLNGTVIGWTQRTGPRAVFDENITASLKEGINVLVLSAVNYDHDIDLSGHIDVGGERIALGHDRRQLRRSGLVYQAVFVLSN